MSFLTAIKNVLNTKAAKVEEVKDAKVRTQEFVKEFADVGKTHHDELLDAARKLHSVEVIKDKASEKAAKAAQSRKEEERLVFAVESIVDQIGVVAEEILDLEDAFNADQEAIKVAKDASKDVLDALSRMDANTALTAARARRARKAAEVKDGVSTEVPKVQM